MASVFHSISLICMVLLYCTIADDRKVHIAYMGSLPQGNYNAYSHHLDILQEVLDNSFPAENALIRSYNRSFNGFAALLTEQQASKLASMKNVVSVFPSQTYELHTTRSWDFMGFKETIGAKPSNASDVIIGVIDTGIWPEAESFSDEGFSPPPKRWKGVCAGGKLGSESFKCNNKIIGVRYYAGESGHDVVGHGTHTASTAAGNKVEGVSFYGMAQGTARGGLPAARIAAYKPCSGLEPCRAVDILAAFDDAIADGVDIITVPMGSYTAQQFQTDVVAIGSFHSMAKGILTLQSAGNTGPELKSVTSMAPWLLSVGGSSIDRRIINKVILGDGRTIVGNSANSFSLNQTDLPLVYGKEIARSDCSESDAQTCTFQCLDRTKVAGKIVLCRGYEGIYESNNNGAAGVIAETYGSTDVSYVYPLPAAVLSDEDTNLAVSYFNSTSLPKATILKSETIAYHSAPIVGDFSARGPNMYIIDILKPDVVAPAIDILASFSPVAPPSVIPNDKRRVKYSILSGTSMSCPHAAGVAAYVKTVHPDWSPAAVKSAIMTTAWPMNASTNPDKEFAYGSGHINPSKAVDPGLVYDIYREDYLEMLCGLGYDTNAIRLIAGDNTTTCSNIPLKSDCNNMTLKSAGDLNYPSMTSQLICQKGFNATFRRTVTNVSPAKSKYKATITSSTRLNITVVPQVLSFESVNENRAFEVIVTLVGDDPLGDLESGSLVWSDGTHSVRSPIVVYPIIED